MGCKAWVRFPTEASFSLLHVVQTGSGVYPVSYPMGTGGSFPGVKPPKSKPENSPPSNAEVKNGGAIPPLPHTSSLSTVTNFPCCNFHTPS
jgi:hypothetical protein